MTPIRTFISICSGVLLSVLAVPALAADLAVKVQIPRLDVAEYHRPYIAIWIERPDQTIASNLAVWYQIDPKKEDGTEWLKDLRQWWRRGGRGETMPIDGVTGATRPVGEHTVKIAGSDERLARLAPGKYTLVVEATREVGGRELLRLAFDWPGKQAQRQSARGTSEVGLVTLDVLP